jgi:hypothetical protein
MRSRTVLIGVGAVALAGLTLLFAALRLDVLALPAGVACFCAAIAVGYDVWLSEREREKAMAARLASVTTLLDEWGGSFGPEFATDYYGQSFRHHSADHCKGDGQHCPLHNPSDHHMQTWPIVYRHDRSPLIERVCEHGTGHPDPDSVAYLKQRDPDDFGAWGVHGCDGCCDDPEDITEIGDVFSVPDEDDSDSEPPSTQEPIPE